MDWYPTSRLTPEPGKVQTVFCGVCKTEMDCKRSVFGPTGFAEAMGQRGHAHDSFRCPNIKADWHIRAEELFSEGRDTKSMKIRKILAEEIREILETRKVPDEV